MSLSAQIGQIALEIANNAQERALPLRKEREQIEARLGEINALLREANFARERFARFRPEIGGKLQCPQCWIRDESSGELVPIPGTDREDFFKCRKCQLEFSSPA